MQRVKREREKRTRYIHDESAKEKAARETRGGPSLKTALDCLSRSSVVETGLSGAAGMACLRGSATRTH